MAVEKVGEKYKCSICSDEVTVTKAGVGTLVCCEQDMDIHRKTKSNDGKLIRFR